MKVYNLCSVYNDEPVKIYDKCTEHAIFKGSSNDIPKRLMNRFVHNLTIALSPEGYGYYHLIVID